MSDKIEKSEAEWRAQLTAEQFAVCRQKATERPGSGHYYRHHEHGNYLCLCCGAPLFSSDTKYDSGSGWPSFWKPINDEAVATHIDVGHGMRRVEIVCRRCSSHLGHVFDDGPQPTGLRYCVNSISLQFAPSGDKQ
ncbi:MAG: peptide-methionine (R)-S-oxide reductase MsrB [Gammaproteobacteria bacterium]|nr:peptide-methionine (R)-S-oxide reductase MsrB [Gammaproteobacteria bacterium]